MEIHPHGSRSEGDRLSLGELCETQVVVDRRQLKIAWIVVVDEELKHCSLYSCCEDDALRPVSVATLVIALLIADATQRADHGQILAWGISRTVHNSQVRTCLQIRVEGPGFAKVVEQGVTMSIEKTPSVPRFGAGSGTGGPAELTPEDQERARGLKKMRTLALSLKRLSLRRRATRHACTPAKSIESRKGRTTIV